MRASPQAQLTYRPQRPLLLSLVLLCLLATSATFAQTSPVVSLTVTPLYEGNVIQDTWLPLRVTFQNTGGDRRVRVETSTPESGVIYGQDVDLTGGGSKEVLLYTLPDGRGDTLDIVVREGGVELARATAKIRVRTGERMLAVVANQPVQLVLPRREDIQTLPFLPFDLQPAQLPDQAAGLGTLSTIVLHDIDTNSLSAAQRQALLIWVANGGQLVLSGGPNATTTLAGLPPELRPAEIGGTQSGLAGTALASFAAITQTLAGTFDGVQLAPTVGSRVLIAGDQPLVIERAFGQGRVDQLAFAVDTAALIRWDGAPRFWDRFLRPQDPSSGITGPPGARLNDTRELGLTASLGNLPALDLPSALPLIALLLVYFLVIGPGIHLVLRRLGRQNWGWAIIPATTLVFAAITYGLGFAFRASDVLVNEVSVVESFGPTAHVRTLVAIYGANPHTYRVAFSGDPLLRPLRSSNGPYGAVDGSPGTYTQGNGATAAVQTSAWAIGGLHAEAQIALPAIDATITITGDKISVRVANPLDQTLRDVAVRYGQQVIVLGDIPVGQQAQSNWLDAKTVDAEGLPSSGDTLGVILFRKALEAGRQPGAIPDRTVVLRQNMLDALLSNGPRPQSLGPTLVGWLDTSPLPATVTSDASIVIGHTTLLLGQPAIRAAAGPIQLGPGWLNLDFLNSNSGSLCSSADGSVGLPVSTNPMSLTLALPPELGQLRASKLTLTLNSLRTWPNAGVQTALYNWDTQAWDAQRFDGPGDLLVDQPEHYLRNGRVVVRLGGRIAEANCLTAGGTVEGTMP